jgi:hypothetical protein
LAPKGAHGLRRVKRQSLGYRGWQSRRLERLHGGFVR